MNAQGDAAADSTVDAVADVPADASADTDADACMVITLGDAGPFQGQWTNVPCADRCSERIPVDVNASVPILQWIPCASGRAGCSRLLVDWTPYRGATITFDEPEGVRLVHGAAVATYNRFYPSRDFAPYPNYAMQVVEQVGSRALGAVAADLTDLSSYCGLALAVGESGLCISGSKPNVYPDAGEILSWSGWTDLSSFSPALFVDFPSLGLTQGVGQTGLLSVGNDRLVFGTEAPIGIDIFDLATHAVTVVSKPSRPSANWPIAVAGGAYDRASSPPSVIFAANDGSWQSLVTPIAPRIPSGLAVDRSSGEAFAWVECVPQPTGCTQTTLWTSPYATSAAAVVAKKVAVLADPLGGGGFEMIANRGVVLTLSTATTAIITRLSDGAGWTVTAEPGDQFVQPLWVDDDEVWLLTAEAGLTSAHAYSSGVTRIRRDTLGVPDMASGL